MITQTICDAIKNRKILAFQYKNGRRTVEPHLLGYNDDGALTLSAWQRSGGSGEDWRDFQVARLSGLAVVEGPSEAPRPGYNPLDEKMFQIMCRL